MLTFGDKLAAAMAQMALRKTAREKKAVYPEAAEALLKNAYMDDICDSVHTATEAKQRVKDLNIVLGTGGFKVKVWTSNKSMEDKVHQTKPTEVSMFQGDVVHRALGMG